MKNFIAGCGAFLTLAGSLGAAQAATFDFAFENNVGIRAIRADILGAGDVTGFSPMGRGSQVFQVVLPDGQCRGTLRITFNDSNGRYQHSYYDMANHDFCTGLNGLSLSTK